MKKSITKNDSKNIIDIVKDIYKSLTKPQYQTRKPEITNHEQSMDIWLRQNDECSGSRMPYHTR